MNADISITNNKTWFFHFDKKILSNPSLSIIASLKCSRDFISLDLAITMYWKKKKGLFENTRRRSNKIFQKTIYIMHIPNYGMFFSIAPTKTNVCFDIFLMIHGFIQFFNMITHKNLNFHFFFLFQNNMEKEIQILTFLNNLILD